MKAALVLGGAKSLEEDVAAARAIGSFDAIIATNHAGRDWPEPLRAWCSFHAELFPKWLEARRAAGRPDPGSLWTAERPLGLELELDIPLRRAEHWGGSSGLLAVTVALRLGFRRIVLAGVPLTPQGEHYDRPGLWSDAGNYRRAWIARYPVMKRPVRSMSGWTREQLGAPTAEWLDGGEDKA